MKKFDIEGIASHAWDLAVKHWGIIVSVLVANLLIYFSLEYITFTNEFITHIKRGPNPDLINIQVFDPEDIQEILGILLGRVTLLSFLEFFVTAYFFIVILRMSFSAIRTGKLFVSAGEAFNVGFKRYVVFVCVGIVTYLVDFICFGIPNAYYTSSFIIKYTLSLYINLNSWGVVCYIFFSIFLGIFLNIRLLFANVAVAIDNVGFGEAFSRSWNMTRGHFWELLLLGIEASGIILIGIFACCVGVLFAFVIVNFMLVLAYFELKGDEQQENMEEAVELVEP